MSAGPPLHVLTWYTLFKLVDENVQHGNRVLQSRGAGWDQTRARQTSKVRLAESNHEFPTKNVWTDKGPNYKMETNMIKVQKNIFHLVLQHCTDKDRSAKVPTQRCRPCCMQIQLFSCLYERPAVPRVPGNNLGGASRPP